MGLAQLLSAPQSVWLDLLTSVPTSSDTRTWAYVSAPDYVAAIAQSAPTNPLPDAVFNSLFFLFAPFDAGEGLTVNGWGLRAAGVTVAFGPWPPDTGGGQFLSGIVQVIATINIFVQPQS